MPRKYQPVIIKETTKRSHKRPALSYEDKKLLWQEELAKIEAEQERKRQNPPRQGPRRQRTFRYSRTDLEFFDRVEELYGWTKAQLIEHIIRLEDSLEHLQWCQDSRAAIPLDSPTEELELPEEPPTEGSDLP